MGRARNAQKVQPGVLARRRAESKQSADEKNHKEETLFQTGGYDKAVVKEFTAAVAEFAGKRTCTRCELFWGKELEAERLLRLFESDHPEPVQNPLPGDDFRGSCCVLTSLAVLCCIEGSVMNETHS